MQRPVDVKVNLAAFVPEVAGSAVLALMQVCQSRQLWVLWLGPAGCGPRVHSELPIEMGWWLHPGEIKVSRLLGAAPYVQRLFEVCRVHLITQCRLLARGGKALELPGLVGAVLDQVGAEGDLQPLGQYGRGDEVIPPLEGRHGLTGERPLLALEASVLVIEVGAGKGERPAPG